MKHLLLNAGGGHSASIKKSFLFSCFTILVLCVSFSIAGESAWISFKDGSVLRGPQVAADLVSYGNLAVSSSASKPVCNLQVNFPGASVWYPNDNGLLAGKYAALNFHADPSDVKIHGANFNGVLRPDKLGKPDLPYVIFQVMIPSSVSKVKVAVANETFVPVANKFNVAPVQEKLPESFILGVDIDKRAFQSDASVYAKDAYFSNELEYEVLDMHGLKFVEVRYSPAKYNPVTQTLAVSAKAQFSITYLDGDLTKADTDDIFYSVVANSTLDGISGDINKRVPVSTTRGGKVAVVYHQNLYNTQAYKDWKAYREAQNFRFVKEIDGSNMSGSRITSALKDAYSQNNKLDYVIIVGDENLIKIPTNPSGSNYHYKNYTRFSGNDQIDDVCLGLFIINKESQLQNILNHQKWHEQGGSWEDEVLMAAGMEGSGTTFARFSSSHYVTPHLDKPGSGGLGYTCHRVYKVPRKPTRYGGSGSYLSIPATRFEEWTLTPNPFFTSSSAASNKVVEHWNKDVALMGHRDHGSGSGTGPSSPSIKYSLFGSNSRITSKSSPYFTCLNCSSGNFRRNHSKCYATMATVNKYGNSVVIAGTRTTMSGDNDYNHIALWHGMFPKNGSQGERNMGKIFLAGHMKARNHGRTYFHMFGDPMSDLQCKVGGTPVVNRTTALTKSVALNFDGLKINFEVPAGKSKLSPVSVKLYTPQGKLAKVLLNSKVSAGMHSIPFSSSNGALANGTYLCRLEAAGHSKVINMVIAK